MSASFNDISSPVSASERRIQRLVAEFERRLRESLPKDGAPQTLEQIERVTEEIGESIKESIQRETIEQQGSGFVGSRVRCLFCRRMVAARHRGDRERQFVTLHGAVSVARAYYHCSECGRGFCPLDCQLAVGSGQLSASVVSLLSRFASYLSFREAARELDVVCGVRLSHSTITRYAKLVGKQLQQDHQVRRGQVRQALERGEVDALCPSTAVPTRQQITMDGVIIHVGGQWREVKLGCVYAADRTNGAKDARYFATLADSKRFGSDLHTFAVVAGTLKCRKVAVVADGAEWIWQETGKYFATQEQILDFYHASEHLWNVGRLWHGDKTEAERAAARVWVKQQQKHLLSGKAAEVIAMIDSWETDRGEASQVKRRELAYFREHSSRGRLNYPQFLADGYHIGSGVIESGCKTVVQSRMKGSGMRWSPQGAEAMLYLRAAWCSHQGADFSQTARQALRLA